MTVPSLIILLSALVICLRLLTFRRGPSRHRLGYSIAAWLLIAGTGTSTVRILTGAEICSGGWGVPVVMAVFAFLVIRARGNVAHIIQLRRV